MLLQAGSEKKLVEDSIVMTLNHLIVENPETGISLIKIFRPKALNALNSEVLLELKSVLTQESDNPLTKVVILTGEGEKAFIAGADISEMKDKTVSEGVHFAQVGHEVTKLLELMPKPT